MDVNNEINQLTSIAERQHAVLMDIVRRVRHAKKYPTVEEVQDLREEFMREMEFGKYLTSELDKLCPQI